MMKISLKHLIKWRVTFIHTKFFRKILIVVSIYTDSIESVYRVRQIYDNAYFDLVLE